MTTSRVRKTLSDEVENSLCSLTEDNLHHLCKCSEISGKDVGKDNKRSLRRVILEAFWEKVDSEEQEGQGIYWLLRLQEDIRRVREEDGGAPLSSTQSSGGDRDGGDTSLLTTNILVGERVGPNQSNSDARHTEKLDEEVVFDDPLEADTDPESVTSEHKERLEAGFLHPSSPARGLLPGLEEFSEPLRTTGEPDVGSEAPEGDSTCQRELCGQRGFTKNLPEKHHAADDPDTSLSKSKQTDKQLQRRRGKTTDHSCTLCEKRFPRQAQLKIHQRIHSGEKPYCCSQCGKAFNQKGHLKMHNKTHTQERLHPCSACDKRFALKSSLTVHEKTHMPSTESLHECSYCEKKFSVLAAFKCHLKMHTQDKTFQCSDCGVQFIHASSLKAHELKHKPAAERPYRCTECDAGFTNKDRHV
ncbi:hypothetical protein DPEC_G00169460 [Dallia pectoralis]|uniref:Uncharacterized protein n=1 Tax=Dallia pectoralis TaxID=75939 RepID=A0ACC2GCR0_DALPE|nr:hypothetical protein DPEC_G00169460 [Dallia pectoralis]